MEYEKDSAMGAKDFAERVIDSAIRGFDPDHRGSYDKWALALQEAEHFLRASAEEIDPSLLASVCAERIRIAYEAEKVDEVQELTATFLREFPATSPTYSFVASLRADALHALGSHEDEIQEVLRTALMPEVRGSEFIYLLATVGERHPGCIPADMRLQNKLQQAIEGLYEQGYDRLPREFDRPIQLEKLARQVAAELRRANRAREESILNELS